VFIASIQCKLIANTYENEKGVKLDNNNLWIEAKAEQNLSISETVASPLVKDQSTKDSFIL